MKFVLVFAGIAAAVSLAITLLVRIGWLIARRRPDRFWKRALTVNALLVPVHLFVVAPAVLAWFVETRAGTRGDERAYAGPRIGRDGTWMLQTRDLLKAESKGLAVPDSALVEGAKAATVSFGTVDGILIRGFLVVPKASPPRCTVVLVHGLFRGGLEIETPASMFRDLGAEVLLVEMRNHGGSGRASPTFGFREKLDVLAAVSFLRRDAARAARPLVLYAVSLGTAAVMRAAPEVTPLAGLVLDAPMEDLLQTAHLMAAEKPTPGHRAPDLWQPWRSLTFTAIEIWSGFRFRDVRPVDDVARLPASVPALVMGGSEDVQMPPDSVRRVWERVPAPPDRKILWIRQGTRHGQLWNDDPGGYRARLAELMKLAVP
jgi:pimeloyl-ACP methyl ester carboxylesterase